MKDIINITDYKDWLQNLKGKIQQSQINGFLQTLSADLCKEFPTMKGFSYRNLKSIRQ